jgi:hypothetical protein
MGLRIYSPTADLPPDISISGSIYTDEGNQCHNSRSAVLYGDWYPDDWRISNYSPVVPYFKYLLFKWFGVGLVQERVVSYFFAFLSILFFTLILKSYFDFTFSVLGVLFFGFNYFLIMFSKIGTFETPMIFWMILALYFIEKFRNNKHLSYLVLSGISAFMSFVFKNIAGYFVPVPVAAVVIWILFTVSLKNPGLKISLKQVAAVLFGVLLAFSLWFFLFYLPNKEWILSVPGQYISNQVLPKNPGQAIRNFFGFNWKEQFYKIPVIWLLAILYVPVFFRNLLRKKSDITELGFVMLFFFHTLFYMFMNHRPTRYLIPVIPAMIFMMLLLLNKIVRRPDKPNSPYSLVQRISLFFLDTTWMALGASFCFLPLFVRYVHSIRIPPLSASFFIFSALVVLAIYGVSGLVRKLASGRISRIPVAMSLSVVFLVSGVSLSFDAGHYLEWNRNKTHTVCDLSRELGERLEHAYIAGLTAPVAVLENRHKSLFLYPGFVNWDDRTFEKYPLTHALLASFNQEISNFFRKWPEKMKHARLLKVVNVKEQFLHLYSFVDPYIDDVRQPENRIRQLRITNPAGQPVEASVRELILHPPGHSGSIKPMGYRLETERENVRLNPGINVIRLQVSAPEMSSPEPVLYFLNSNPWGNRFRYEGEKFPGKVGENRRVKDASGRFVRSFSLLHHQPGFLSFGPFVPFSEGFISVDFYLKCSHIHSRIRPLVKLDIFSYTDRKSLASRILKPADVNRDGWAMYRLSSVIPDIRFLEFRIYAEGWCDIDFDYVNVVYYQGLWFNPDGNAGNPNVNDVPQGGKVGS